MISDRVWGCHLCAALCILLYWAKISYGHTKKPQLLKTGYCSWWNSIQFINWRYSKQWL